MKKQNLVVQDNSLINAKFNLTRSELDLFLLAVKEINSPKFDKELQTVTMHKIDLEKELGVTLKSSQLKDMTTRLLSKNYFFIYKDDEDWEAFTLFRSFKYANEMFTMRLNDEIKHLLLDLQKNYVKYNLEYTLKMSSFYAKRVYQMLKQYEKIGNKTINIDEIRELFVVPKSLLVYNNFKQKVLAVSVEQINEHTDLEVSFTEIKTGRKVTDINFTIKSKQKKELVTNSLIDEAELENISLPVKVAMMIGLKGITSIQGFTDGSFKVLFEDEKEHIFKSEKQLKLFFDKDFNV